MDHHLREQRRMAAQAFLESLEQLGDQIQDGTITSPPNHQPQQIMMDALEAAVTDIEHMLEGDDTSP